MEQYIVTILEKRILINGKDTVLQALKKAGISTDAPCGGQGKCGKCKVKIQTGDSLKEVLACQTYIDSDMTVFPMSEFHSNILTDSLPVDISVNPLAENPGYVAAFDIGSTTVVGFLMDGRSGEVIATSSLLNPQVAYGADVITRIQAALHGEMGELSDIIRKGLGKIVLDVCSQAQIQPNQIALVSIVGNPCMQQIFLGIMPENLATPPFSAVINHTEVLSAADYIPSLTGSLLLNIPDISGYVGSDTIGCILSTKLYTSEKITLLVDIGTNGEMVLGNRERMISCSTAAGPALEGARIKLGMRGTQGAIDHVWLEDKKIVFSTIGNAGPAGICGSGLIDIIAVMLQLGCINARGRIQPADQLESVAGRLIEMDGDRAFLIANNNKEGLSPIYITQQDIREVQLAKGAIAAGIEIMAGILGIEVLGIDEVLLAGAFGSFINAQNACRIGLLPSVLESRVKAVGNAAGAGARIAACNKDEFYRTDQLIQNIEFLELASSDKFQGTFAKNMYFNLSKLPDK